MKQYALIVRALNFNVGLQEYIVVYITTLKGIGMIMSAFKEESASDGVLVIIGVKLKKVAHAVSI